MTLDTKLLARMERHSMPEPMSGCQIWLKAVDVSWGYGIIKVNRKVRKTHREAWRLHNGPIPEGKWVLHRCDTPCCINVDHLFLGDNAVNMADMAKKLRSGVSKLV